MGARIVGIDYEKEKDVVKLQEYLVTPYKEKKLWVENLLEQNVKRFYRTSIQWKVKGGSSVPKDGSFPAGTRIYCEEIRSYIPKSSTAHSTNTSRSYIAFTLNDQQKIIFIEEDMPPEHVEKSQKLSPEGLTQWQTFFDKMSATIENRSAPDFLVHFDPNFRTENCIDRKDPFQV